MKRRRRWPGTDAGHAAAAAGMDARSRACSDSDRGPGMEARSDRTMRRAGQDGTRPLLENKRLGTMPEHRLTPRRSRSVAPRPSSLRPKGWAVPPWSRPCPASRHDPGSSGFSGRSACPRRFPKFLQTTRCGSMQMPGRDLAPGFGSPTLPLGNFLGFPSIAPRCPLVAPTAIYILWHLAGGVNGRSAIGGRSAGRVCS